MRGSLTIIAGLLLSGCNNDPIVLSRSDVEDLAADVAAAETDALRTEVAELRERLEDLEKQLGTVRDLSLANSDSQDSLRQTFNNNVDLSNREKVEAMTRRGACGTRTVALEGGGIMAQPIPCTLDDLR